MSRVLLGQTYFLRFDPKLWEAMQPYPPLGTLYAASYLRDRGHEVALFDAMLADSEAEWAVALDRNQPEWAVLFEDNFNYLSKMCLLRMREAALTMITMAKDRGCQVVVAGADATDHAELYLRHGADYVLIGEGEETLGELLGEGVAGGPGSGVRGAQGLAYRDPTSGEIIRNPRRPDIKNLDALPFPAWDLVDVDRYRTIWRTRHGRYSINVVTTRGCPYHCNWCAKPIWGQRYQVRSPENVVAELKWLSESVNPDHIWFADDIVGLKPGWLKKFADLLEAEGIRIPFKCLSRADLLLRPSDIDHLRRAGCETVWLGAESGSQKILDAMDKGTKVEQISEAARRLQEAGIRVGFFLQFGYPGETWDDVQQTLAMVRSALPDDIGVSVSYPLPGTKFYDRVRSELGSKQNWRDSDDLAMLYQGPFSTAFYRTLHAVVHKEFRARRHWRDIRKSGLVTSLRKRRRQIAALAYYLTTLPISRAQLRLRAR